MPYQLCRVSGRKRGQFTIVIRAMNKMQRKEDAKVDLPKAPEIPADVKLLAEIRDQRHC